jgi:drug/metabolite transporter (DMT)-like permease
MLIGPTFLLYKLCLKEFSPLTIIFLRTAVGSLFLLPVFYFKKLSLPKEKSMWFHLFVMGILACALPFSLFSLGSVKLNTGISSIANASVPIFTLLFNYLFLKNEPISTSKVLGIFLGCVGVLSLFVPLITNNIVGDTLAMVGLVIGCISYAAGYNYGKKYVKNINPITCSFIQMIFSACVMLPLIFILENPLEQMNPSGNGKLLITLFALQTAVCFLLIYKVIELTGPTSLSMVYYLQPVIALMLGKLYLDEHITLIALFGCGLIFLGLLYVNEVFTVPSLKKKEDES